MIEIDIAKAAQKAFLEIYNKELNKSNFIPSKTKEDFKGDFTIIVFPFLSYAKQSPDIVAENIGNNLIQQIDIIKDFNVVKGFLNLTLNEKYWINYSQNLSFEDLVNLNKTNPENIVVEFSSPNTNKPLHLGHIRNNLLGISISNILAFVGHNVTRVSLLNDRGIHICKTMISWEEFGNKITPEEANIKGDHLIGEFYVKFDQEYKKEIQQLVKTGLTEEEAAKQAPLIKKAKKLLKKWERNNKIVKENWSTLNSWVIKGFEETYKKLGVKFDKIYLESNTYLKGKDIVMRELTKGGVKFNSDNSVSIDLTDKGLDEKILLRADGTSVYITQDIGTAVLRYNEFEFDKQIYVVGNEQIYHFKVLKEILSKFGYDWANKLVHYSYGMVELPDGKMKSREGKVVDADDLIQEMINTATNKANELGKLNELSNTESEEIIKKIAMGALKYFILKVDPKKNMMFNPEESIDYNGNTGPFIQYTYTRINSLLEKAKAQNIKYSIKLNTDIPINNKELHLIKKIYNFNNTIQEAAKNLNPASIANYVFDLAKIFNSFYQEFQILKADSEELKIFRLKLAENVALTLKVSLKLLGINVPSKM